MKIETKYRYLVWVKRLVGSRPAEAYSSSTNKMSPTLMGWSFESGDRDTAREPHLDGLCPGEWDDYIYDTENEKDVKLLRALMEL